MNKVETCLYPYHTESGRLLLAHQRGGQNDSLWVPIGRAINRDEFAWDIVTQDLLDRTLDPDALRHSGCVSEWGENGWKTYLILFVALQSRMPTIEPDQFATEYRWVTLAEASRLRRPQSDVMFNYSFLEKNEAYYDEFVFNSDEVCRRRVAEPKN